MRPKNIFMLDKEVVLIVKDSKHLDFKNIDEFKLYANDVCGHFLDDKSYVYYDAENKVHTDLSIEGTSWTGRISLYDTIIDAFDLISNRKINPFYGLLGRDLFDAQNEFDIKQARSLFYNETVNGVVVDIPEGVNTFTGGKDSARIIQGAIDLATSLNESMVEISDHIGNSIHMTVTSARLVQLKISEVYRTAFFKKQSSLVEIENRVYSE